MKTWLITGGAGFIGSNFVRHCLQQKNLQIINLDKLTYAGNLKSLEDVFPDLRHCFIKGSINDRTLLDRLMLLYRPQAIVHLAAESHVDRSIQNPEAFLTTNVMGTFTLLEAALAYWSSLQDEEKQAFRFLHVSTDEVYGSLGPTGYFKETSPYAPNSPYAASKAASDHLVRSYHKTYGLPILVTHCSNNYGPRQFPEKLIPTMILRALDEQPLPVYGNGLNVRDWIFVEDHCRSLCQVLEHGQKGSVYNIGGDCEKSNLQVVHAICELLDQLRPRKKGGSYQDLIQFTADRPGHDFRYAVDCEKITQELGWFPQESFSSGLQKTVQWYLDNPQWWQPLYKRCQQ